MISLFNGPSNLNIFGAKYMYVNEFFHDSWFGICDEIFLISRDYDRLETLFVLIFL